MKKTIITATMLFLLAGNVMAQSPQLYDPQSGKYLGNLNNDQLDPNSVSNPLGRYGSSLSPDSINNPLGKYGSSLSPSSVNNPLATQAPVIIAPQNRWQR